MSALSASQIVGIWERGLRQARVDRAITLAAVACPDCEAEQLTALRLGRRDALLFSLRESIFGPTMNASATCPRCAETVEFTLRTTDLNADAAADGEETHELSEEGVVVRFRVPNSADLRAIAQCGDVSAARSRLLECCVLDASHGGEALGCADLSEPLVAKLAARLAETDPLADITLDLKCAGCGHLWCVALDIAAFLWSEIDAFARRLMLEVHALARAYGWSEADILAMGAGRRQFYLEMAG